MKANELDWKRILTSLGVNSSWISNPKKNGPCPIENGGKTRFRFDNKGNRGTWICNHCGAGGGVKLVAMILGVSNEEAWKKIKEIVDGNKIQPISKNFQGGSNALDKTQQEINKATHALKKAWEPAQFISEETPAWKYISNRVKGLKLEWLSGNLRYRNSMYHLDQETGEISYQHAIVARVIDARNKSKAVSIHRTYVSPDGKKANVSSSQVKKLMSPSVQKITGESIKVNNKKSEHIIVAEGIEAALAWVAATRNEFAVYAAINCLNLGRFTWPKETKGILVAGDNDPPQKGSGVRPGLHHANLLYQRAIKAGLKSKIVLPHIEGLDFDDLWNGGVISTFDLGNFAQ